MTETHHISHSRQEHSQVMEKEVVQNKTFSADKLKNVLQQQQQLERALKEASKATQLPSLGRRLSRMFL